MPWGRLSASRHLCPGFAPFLSPPGARCPAFPACASVAGNSFAGTYRAGFWQTIHYPHAMSSFTKIFQKWLPESHLERSPFATLHSTRRWVEQLQFHHEYEAHQMVVDALNQFNLSSTVLDERKLHILAVLRNAGCKLQENMVAQYLKNQTTFRYAGKSLWQEIFAFYWQLALAYQSFVKAATRNQPALAPQLATITLLALYYQGKLIQWRYMRYEAPTSDAWRNVHALYAIAECNGFADRRLKLGDNADTSCSQVHAHILLLNLINPLGQKPWKIELTAHWTHSWCRQLQSAAQFNMQVHTHWLDLAGCEPLRSIGDPLVKSNAVRYWSLQSVLTALEITRAQLLNPPSSPLDGIKKEAEVPGLLDDIRATLTRGGQPRHTQRQEKNLSAFLACGFEQLLQILRGKASDVHSLPLEPWIMQDAGDDGYGLTHYAIPATIPEQGALIGLRTEAKNHPWALAAIRWIEHQPGYPIRLGAERLGTSPRIVALHGVDHLMSESIFSLVNPPADCAPTPCIYLPGVDEQRFTSALVVGNMNIAPAQIYDMLDGDYIYRVRITHEQSRSRDWLQLKFNILTRRHVEMVNL